MKTPKAVDQPPWEIEETLLWNGEANFIQAPVRAKLKEWFHAFCVSEYEKTFDAMYAKESSASFGTKKSSCF